MDIPLGVFFGILAMLSWGIGDFLAAKCVRKEGVFKILFWMQAIGLVLIIPIFSVFFQFPLLSLTTIGIILVLAFLDIAAWAAFYKGMKIGKISVISPITSAWAALTVILSLVFLNETLTMLQGIGVFLAILGTICASFKFRELIKLKLKNPGVGIKYAIIALVGWGVWFAVFDVLVTELSWFLPVFLTKIVMVFYLFTYAGVSKQNISFPRNTIALVALIAVLDIIAFLSYSMGVIYEFTAIVAPITAAFPVVTMILARIFFKEHMEINQKLGVTSIITGIVLLAL